MGAWGTGPFDNDGAADMMAGISREITKALKPKSNRSASYHYQEARAAAALLLFSHGTDILGGPSLEPALQALKRMRGDEEWIGVWRSELEICQQLDKEIRALRRKIKTCCAPKKAEAERAARKAPRGRTIARVLAVRSETQARHPTAEEEVKPVNVNRLAWVFDQALAHAGRLVPAALAEEERERVREARTELEKYLGRKLRAAPGGEP